MPSTQEIKRRIKAVQSTGQITRAMELVSATKMRKSQQIALDLRPYALQVLRILAFLQTKSGGYVPKLLQQRPVKKTAVLIISSDRGLAGSFNANVFKKIEAESARTVLVDTGTVLAPFVYITVGKRAADYLQRKGAKVIKQFHGFGDFVETEETRPLTEFLVQGFQKGQWDEVIAVSTHFRTTLKQDVLVRQVLPINAERIKQAVQDLVPEYGRFADLKWISPELVEGLANSFEHSFEYLIEPDAKTILNELAPKLIEIVVHSILLEANASEHSARMVAMKNASENASELKDQLLLDFNKLRQAAITQEITEIVSGTEVF